MQLNYNGLILTLPNPDFGDNYNEEYRRIINRSQGNELLISPKSGFEYLKSFDSLNYKFTFLSEVQKQQLINFLDISIGQPIVVTDYNDVIWNGIITTPSNEVTNSARNNNEFSLDIDILPPIVGCFLITQGYGSDNVVTQGMVE